MADLQPNQVVPCPGNATYDVKASGTATRADKQKAVDAAREDADAQIDGLVGSVTCGGDRCTSPTSEVVTPPYDTDKPTIADFPAGDPAPKAFTATSRRTREVKFTCALKKAAATGGAKQAMIPVEQLESYLADGAEYAGLVTEREVVVTLPLAVRTAVVEGLSVTE
ncbi:MAG: hypothetical protein HYX51_03055 [Chloroflexi bacterium]|nr:hypothetical protein [Chloroflexota bacterium]